MRPKLPSKSGYRGVLAHDREQVDDAAGEVEKRGGEIGACDGEVLDDAALEGGAVGNDGGSARARLQQGESEDAPGVIGAFGEPFVVVDPIGMLDVDAELHRHALIRRAPWPARDRGAHGLEVEERHGRAECPNRGGGIPLDDQLSGLDRKALALANALERLGDVLDAFDAAGEQLGDAAAAPVEGRHVVLGERSEASRLEGARVRRGAVRARGDQGQRAT